ncbi:MAG: class I SAM-dependent methyltransferase [Treponema sp.]|jgi:SAM-dependent methyltransferase|nr:class I SAM-dependent methyltransferase [Treponema sp.]
MFERFLQNARKPQGIDGKLFVAAINSGHSGVSLWGLRHLDVNPEDSILDIGCGGGINVARMLRRTSAGRVCGLDYSDVGVAKSASLNRKAIRVGRTEMRLGGVSRIPWADNSFDAVTAFETVYFWDHFANDLQEVRRVLKPDGLFFVCNEMNKPEQGETSGQYWIKTLGLTMYGPAEFQASLTAAGCVGPKPPKARGASASAPVRKKHKEKRYDEYKKIDGFVG